MKITISGNLTVTHTLSPEVLALLRTGSLATPVVPETLVSNDQAKDATPVIKKVRPKAEVAKAVAPAPEAETKTEKLEGITADELRAEVRALIQGGKREAVISLLAEYDTVNLTELAPALFSEFSNRLKTL